MGGATIPQWSHLFHSLPLLHNPSDGFSSCSSFLLVHVPCLVASRDSGHGGATWPWREPVRRHPLLSPFRYFSLLLNPTGGPTANAVTRDPSRPPPPFVCPAHLYRSPRPHPGAWLQSTSSRHSMSRTSLQMVATLKLLHTPNEMYAKVYLAPSLDSKNSPKFTKNTRNYYKPIHTFHSIAHLLRPFSKLFIPHIIKKKPYYVYSNNCFSFSSIPKMS